MRNVACITISTTVYPAGQADRTAGCATTLHAERRALADRVLVIPTLIKSDPQPIETILGALTDTHRVMATLGLISARPEESARAQ
jgi:hypothetical protein